jgi:drug/metabolite transporter (DMT)-like permease
MDTLLGGASALASAAIWAFSATYMTAPARTWGARATNFFKSAVATVLFLGALLVWPGGLAGFPAPPEVWGWFIASGVCGLAIADSAYLTSLPHIGPTLTAVVYQASGIFTAALGAAFLNERLTAVEGLGIGVVILGVLLALLSSPPGHVARPCSTRSASS